MLDKLLGNLSTEEQREKDLLKKRMEEIEKERREQREKEKLEILKTIKHFLEEEKVKRELPEFKRDLIYISDSEQTFYEEGFIYNYLVVKDQDDGKEVQVEFLGVSYTITLKKGINTIQLLQDSVITSKTGINVVLIRSRKKLF